MKIKPNIPIYTKYQLQQAYIDVLSVPKVYNKKFKPSPKWSSGVKKSALRGKCTSLIELLSKPQKRLMKKRRRSFQYVRKSALTGKATSWNLKAAFPKLKQVRQTKQLYFRRLGRRQKNATNKLLKQLTKKFEELHPLDGEQREKLVSGATVHLKCFTDPRTENPPKYICQLSQKERKEYLLRMIAMCKPSPKPKPPKPNRGLKKRLSKFDRLNELAVPQIKNIPRTDPFKVKPAALLAEASDRIQELAKHREPLPPAIVYDFRGNEILPSRDWDIASRRRIVTSERTIELAIPKRIKKKAVEDTKDDPFMVSRAALKAVCTERINELAKPIERD